MNKVNTIRIVMLSSLLIPSLMFASLPAGSVSGESNPLAAKFKRMPLGNFMSVGMGLGVIASGIYGSLGAATGKLVNMISGKPEASKSGFYAGVGFGALVTLKAMYDLYFLESRLIQSNKTFWQAIETDDTNLLKEWATRDASILMRRDTQGRTPLQLAAIHRKNGAVGVILKFLRANFILESLCYDVCNKSDHGYPYDESGKSDYKCLVENGYKPIFDEIVCSNDPVKTARYKKQEEERYNNAHYSSAYNSAMKK